MKSRITRVSAYALVLSELGNDVLLCRISAQIPEHAGKWTLPGGGIEFGETPEDAVVREVKEETGLAIQPTTIAGVDSLHLEREDHAFHAIRILYRTRVIAGELQDELQGTTDRCAWWARDRVAELPLVELVRTGLKLLD